MKALSVKQPWAWAIFHGKDVENRSWATNYRGSLLIHASKTFDWEGLDWLYKNSQKLGLIIPAASRLEKGAILGSVAMVECVEHSTSPWFFGPYGFVFTMPKLFDEPIPYKGQRLIFEVSDEVILAISPRT